LGQTNGNDDNWYPAWSTATGAGKAVEQEKSQTKTQRQAQVFTSEPASSNQVLMDFEAQLMLKAGKKPPSQKPVETAQPPSMMLTGKQLVVGQ